MANEILAVRKVYNNRVQLPDELKDARVVAFEHNDDGDIIVRKNDRKSQGVE